MSGRHAAALALFTLFLVAVQISYVLTDRRPPTYDDAWYLENSLIFYHRLTETGLRGFVPAYAASFGTKAPLISVLPLPFYLIFGASRHAAMLVNTAFIVITNIFLYLLVRRQFSAGAGLAAVAFYQTMPLAYGLSRVFMADYALAALVVAWLYFLLVSDGLTRGGVSLFLGMLLGVGLLLKILFPAYIAGPLLLEYWRGRGRKNGWKPWLTIGLPGVAIASTWYAFHLGTILRYAWQGAYGEIGQQYGFGGVWHWVVLVVNRGLSFYYTLLLILAGLAALIGRSRGVKEHSRGVRLLLAWLVPPLIATAAGSNREIRFVIPLLPVFAIFLALGVLRLARRPLAQGALAAGLLVFPLGLFAQLSFHGLGSHDHDHPVHAGPFLLFSRDLGWARPPDAKGDWGQQRILEALRTLGPPSHAPRYVVVGIEHPYLNANLLSYLNAYSQYPLLFTSLGYAEPSVERAIERVYRLDARYLVMGEGFHSHDLTDFLNQVNHEVQARLDRGELPYRLRAKVGLAGEGKAAIYGRESRWTSFAPGQDAPRPGHPLQVDFAGGAQFLGHDWNRKTGALAELTCYWSTPHVMEEDFRIHIVFHRGGRVVLAQDHAIADGRHPFFEWRPGEVVRQTLVVFVPREGPLDADLWLARWGIGGPQQIRLPVNLIHRSIIPLRLEE